jgi:hypothetical protein
VGAPFGTIWPQGNGGGLGNVSGGSATITNSALQAGSPAIDAVTGGCPPPGNDQRNVVRPLDGNGDGTARCDIGAYELSLVSPPPVVPELSTLLMFGSGLAGLGGYALTRARTARGRRRRLVA